MFGQLVRALGIFAREYARETIRDLGVSVAETPDENAVEAPPYSRPVLSDGSGLLVSYGPYGSSQIIGVDPEA